MEIVIEPSAIKGGVEGKKEDREGGDEKEDGKEEEEEEEEVPLKFLLGLGTPHDRPLYKLIGYGGGLVHTSQEFVWRKMRE